MPADPASPSLYRGDRFPSEIIADAVWRCFRFSLSLRDVQELLAEPGVTVTYETIREGCAKFGPASSELIADARISAGPWTTPSERASR